METTPTPSDWERACVAYLRHVRVEKRLAERTLVLYDADLRLLRELAGRDGLAPAQVRSAQVRRWVAQRHAQGHSPRDLARLLSSWRGFYRWWVCQGEVEHNPVLDVRAPRAGAPLPKALGVEDAVRLAEHADEEATPALAARDRAVVELLYGAGLRIGELVGLDHVAGAAARGWVDGQAGEIHVLGKGSKWRSVPLGASAREALQVWLTHRVAWAGDDPALFIGAHGRRLGAGLLRTRLRKRSIEAGLAQPVHPHMLRHSCASHVLQSSADLRGVQELLGHASIRSTQVYTRLDFQHLARVYEAAHPRAHAGPGSLAVQEAKAAATHDDESPRDAGAG